MQMSSLASKLATLYATKLHHSRHHAIYMQVRTAVKASFYTLPTRQGFLESIGETGVCSRLPSSLS